MLSQEDINELYRIATSLRYNGNIEKKYELIDAVMRPRGFRRGNCGTNRVVYNFLELPTFVAKIALDKVGMKDSPAEFKNQNFFKPFCCKIHEVDPTGVIAFVERVNPISSIEEFASVADDVFNMMITKVIGKYVVDDLGASKYMNYGIRQNSNGYTFGPVIIDFPYAYELDGGKLICNKPIKTPLGEVPCMGEIDYDAGLNNLYCQKCGRKYTAQELARDDKDVIIMYDDVKGAKANMRARIVTNDGKVIKDSGRSSKTYITRDEFEIMGGFENPNKPNETIVTKTIRTRSKPIKQLRRDYHNDLYEQLHKSLEQQELFNPVIKPVDNTVKVTKTKRTTKESVEYSESKIETGTPTIVSETIYPDGVKPIKNAPYDINVVNETMSDEEPKTETTEVHAVILEHGKVNKNKSSISEDCIKQMIENKDTTPIAITHEVEDNEDEPEVDFGHELATTIMGALRGNDSYEEPDYSDYEPEEDEEDQDYDTNEYEDYMSKPNRNNKKHKRHKQSYDDDMSDY